MDAIARRQLLDVRCWKMVAGYAVTIKDAASSSLIVATVFGHVIVAITTKVLAVIKSLRHATRR